MKKLLSLLLLATLLLSTLLAACSEDVGSTSSVPSQGENVSSETESSEDPSQDTSSGEEEAPKVPVRENPNEAVISLGKTYTNTAQAGEKYPDSYTSELTDGKYAPDASADYNDALYAGFHGNETLYITIDLGEVYDTLYQFRVSYLSTNNAGVVPPQKVRVFVSEDGEKFNNAGDAVIPEFVEGCRQEAVLNCEFYATGRYVRLAISKNGWLFLDELVVIADEEAKVNISEVFSGMVKDAYDTLGTVSFTATGEAPDMTKAPQLISQGKKYTITGEIVKRFPNAGSPLTDGKCTGIYSSGKWVGVEAGEAIEVVVDLGKERNDLYRFSLMCYANFSGGDCLPVAVTYAISSDGENFTDIGRIYAPTSMQTTYDYPLSLAACVTSRYVKFTVEATETAMYLMEEASVYVRDGETGVGSIYPNVVFDAPETPWENPSTETKNLLAGLIQQVYVPADSNNVTLSSCSPWNLPVLTDGWKAGSTYAEDNNIHNGRYFKFQSTAAPMEFFFDLGAEAALSSFAAQFNHRTPWGVQAPSSLTVYVSTDAKNWYGAGVVKIEPESDDKPADVIVTLEKAIKARYVSFAFNTVSWCGISEFEAFGTTSTKGALSIEEAGLTRKEDMKKGYLPPSETALNGASDLCLLYQRADRENYTAKTLLPYLAYVDTDGKIKDTMFDSFLFLMSGKMPSGHNPLGEGDMKDMQWTIDNMFKEGYNILALEEAAGQVKSELNLGKDFKYGVVVTIYDVDPLGTAFGDIDGDGKVDATNTLEKRLKAFEWYMKTFEAKFAEYNFQNIEFVGYYWFREGVYQEHDQPELIRRTADLARARGYSLSWIPWYCAPGVSNWKDYGFDLVCMQPNYVFDTEVPEGRLDQAAHLIQTYGTGVEIEIGYTAMQNPVLRNRYLEYLSGGVKYGYMKDCMHMYYQEITVYYDTAISKDPKVRMIYDCTYQFIKGTLNAYPDGVEVSAATAKDTPVSMKLFDEEKANLAVELVASPAHGSVTLGNDGTLTYYPEAGFTGTVTVTFTYNEGLGESDICTATITVE